MNHPVYKQAGQGHWALWSVKDFLKAKFIDQFSTMSTVSQSFLFLLLCLFWIESPISDFLLSISHTFGVSCLRLARLNCLYTWIMRSPRFLRFSSFQVFTTHLEHHAPLNWRDLLPVFLDYYEVTKISGSLGRRWLK